MTSHASRRFVLGAALASAVVAGWLWRPAAASVANQPAGGVPRIHDDGQKFVAFYGHLEKPLSLVDTWRVLRGLHNQLTRFDAERKVAGIIYYAGGDMYLAAVDFQANEVFIDRVGARQAFTLIWHQVDGDFRPSWALRAPDRIESTDPSQRA